MRRQVFRALTAFILICSVLIVPAYAESATVTGSKVNLRAGPGTNYYIAAVIDKGQPVEVLNRSDASWYYVSYNGTEGFISSAYLSVNGSSSGITVQQPPSVQTAAGKKDCYINADRVRFRSGPGSNYSIIGEYGIGKAIDVVTTVGDWVAGYIDGVPGYVSRQYVTAGSYAAPSVPSSPSGGITVISPSEIRPDYTLPMPDTSQSTGSITVVATPPTPTPTPPSNAFFVPSPAPSPTPTVPAQTTGIAPANTNGREAYVYGTYVRFRTGPGTNYSIIGTYNTGKSAIAYASVGGGWVFCSIDGHEGYISGDYLYVVPDTASDSSSAGSEQQAQSSITVVDVPVATQQPAATQQTKAYITGNNVRFRSSPSMTSKIMGELFYGNQVTLTGYVDGWAQIVSNGELGYVYADYVREGSYGAIDIEPGKPAAGTNVTGQDIVSFAMRYLGAKYCWGGTTPETGFDCSGFVYYVFSNFGKILNRVANDQAANGTHVDPSDLRPGDIICFYSGSSYIGHVGIYIGNDQFIHSSNSTTGVIISELSGHYSSRGFEARRIV